MSGQVKIKTEVQLFFATKYIQIDFTLVEQSEKDRWPKTTLLSSRRISLKNRWGMYKDLQTIAREIAKVQNNFLSQFKRFDGKYFNTVKKLCDAYSGGEIHLEDGATADFIAKFTGRHS